MLVWHDKMAGHQAANGQVSVNATFTWSLLHYNAYQVSSSNMWKLQHHSEHALGMSTDIAYVYSGLQFKWNRLSTNNSYQLYTSMVACWEVTWLNWHQNQMLWEHWDATWQITLDPTGWFCHPVVSQWHSRAHHLHIWNTLEYHRRYRCTGMPLEPHWLKLAPSIPVAIQW